MENRRQHYRHEFAPTRRFVAHLQSAQSTSVLDGEVINLSTSGLCVYAPGLRSEKDAQWVVTLSLENDGAQLSIPAERVYARNGDQACCGFRFLATEDAEAAEERERMIWRFLLAEQRRRRQFLQSL